LMENNWRALCRGKAGLNF